MYVKRVESEREVCCQAIIDFARVCVFGRILQSFAFEKPLPNSQSCYTLDRNTSKTEQIHSLEQIPRMSGLESMIIVENNDKQSQTKPVDRERVCISVMFLCPLPECLFFFSEQYARRLARCCCASSAPLAAITPLSTINTATCPPTSCRSTLG